MSLYCGINLILREFFAGEVTFHVLFTRLGNCLDQGVTDNSEVLFCIFRNLAVLIIGQVRKAAALHLDCVYETDEFLVFADRHLERSDLSSELLLKF